MGVDLGGKPWELSLYELNRKPQPLIIDDTEIAVKPRSLQSELMCPICLDMLKTTMTTKECLHRFCNECICTALRSGNKECPTCRKKLVSRRSLRPDPNFDMLISKIYFLREESDKDLRGKDDGSYQENNHQEVELIFKPLTQENSNLKHTRFLKTTINATVDHLIKYLSMRHFLETNSKNCENEASSFTIYKATGPGEYRPLQGKSTLNELKHKFWKNDKPLELYYGYNVLN